MRPRKPIAIAASATAVLALAACASRGAQPNQPNPSDVTSSAVGSPAAGSPSAGSGDSSGNAAIVAELSADKVAMAKVTSMTMTMTVTSSAMTMKMDGGYVLTPQLEADFTIPTMSVSGQNVGPMHEILTPETLYLSMPQLTAQTGKQWVSVPLDQASSLTGLDLSSLMDQAQQANPSQYLDMLLAGGSLHEVGQESVAGVATKHYVGVIDPATADTQLTGNLKAQLQKLASTLDITSIDVDLWVDDQNLLRKATESYDSSVGPMTTEIDVTAYNTPVTITVPPADQTVDLAAALGQ
ncbi:MAG: hypothetical protein ACRDV3_11480 [Acidothermaceae bacterium]